MFNCRCRAIEQVRITGWEAPFETKTTRHKEVSLLAKSGVAIEKLPSVKITKTKLRYDATQSTLGVRLETSYPPISDRLQRKRSFSAATGDFTHNPLLGKGQMFVNPRAKAPGTIFIVVRFPVFQPQQNLGRLLPLNNIADGSIPTRA